MDTQHTLTHRDENTPEKIQQRPSVSPAVDIFENADELLVIVDLPGVAQESLLVRLEKGELTLEGRRSDSAEQGVNQKNLPDYRRSFVIPQGIDAERISADLQSGVLRVHLPKSSSLKPRKIPITTS